MEKKIDFMDQNNSYSIKYGQEDHKLSIEIYHPFTVHFSQSEMSYIWQLYFKFWTVTTGVRESLAGGR